MKCFLSVVMDVIKMEYESDPLAIEGRVIPCKKEGNVLDEQVIGIKTECMDHSYDVQTEMTFDETPVSNDFPIVKSEVEEEACELNKVEEKFVLEVTTEEDEVFTEGTGVPASSDSVTEDERLETVGE
ncbi:uncharacterized protein [Periplaneta americana]|uniref:uncharacterized protein isoform X5 n=1 Tax=Periplaneta americana TaxID=6978 RepID=UPI0037E79CA5